MHTKEWLYGKFHYDLFSVNIWFVCLFYAPVQLVHIKIYQAKGVQIEKV